MKYISELIGLRRLTLEPIHHFNEEGLPYLWQMTNLEGLDIGKDRPLMKDIPSSKARVWTVYAIS